MSNLGDYIGQLMAEITLARVQADLEAVRLADYYANHPLLKAFPVPRFRLPTVTLDFPVAIKEVQPPRDTKGMDLAQAQKIFAAALDRQLEESEIRLTAAERTNLDTALKRRFNAIKSPDLISTSTVHVADIATNTVDEALPTRMIKGPNRSTFVAELRNRARAELLALLPAPARVKVVTNTAELQEMGPGQVLTRIHLSITEQGLEWKGDENKGAGGKKLLPE